MSVVKPASETTPLLDLDLASSDPEAAKMTKVVTPLPKGQIFVLCFMRFSDPVCYQVIYPFINEMLIVHGISNPGYSSGFIEGAFAFAQLCTVYYWGSLSDRIGRRPVLLFGLISIAFFTSCFGLSLNFPMIVAFRFLSRAATGNLVVLKSAIAEITDETNQARAFSFLSMSWSVGSILAPALGGFLSRPADKLPGLFGSSALFVKFPYLLPCLAASCIPLIGWLIGFAFLEESLGGIEAKKIRSLSANAPDTTTTMPSSAGEARTPPTPSFREIVSDPIIRSALLAYVLMAMVTVSIEALMPLWLYMAVEKGGLGFSTSEIGVILSAVGVLATFMNLIVFPPLQRRIGTVPVYQFCMIMIFILIALFPVVSRIAILEQAGQGPPSLTKVPRLFTKLGVGLMVVTKAISWMVFTCNMILINQSAPSKTTLGAVNGVAQMLASVMRSVAPTVATILFALSTDDKYHLLGGQLIWGYLLIGGACAVVASLHVREERDQSRRL
ncbi:hypothetical protein FRB98_008699 [Tulasnella sp. 332]|nr:hypothetical protein FRB98_008699 [Tulasnella sp. 332]